MLAGSYHNGFAPRDGQPLYPELWRGCIGAWAPCLGPSGLTLRDWSGYGNHGSFTSLTAGSGWVSSAGRYAIGTPGTANVGVTVASNSMLSIPAASPWSVSLWFRRNTAGRNDGVINKAAATVAANEWSVAWFGADLYFIVGDPSASAFIGRRGAWNVTGWRNICCTYDGGTTAAACKIYGDGIQIDTSNYNTGVFASTNPTASNMRLAIDNYLSGTTGFGDFDDIRIYRRMLSIREVKMLGSRRGIAYDFAPRKRTRTLVGFKAYWAARKAQILGGGLQ